MESEGFLDMVFIPGHLILVGGMLVLSEGCQGSDVWVRERRLLHPVTVERGVVGNMAHLGFLKDDS